MGCGLQTNFLCQACLGLEADLEGHLEDDFEVDRQDHLEEDDFKVDHLGLLDPLDLLDHLGRLVLDLLVPYLVAFLPFTCWEAYHLSAYLAAFLLSAYLDLDLLLDLLLTPHFECAYLPLLIILMRPQALHLQQCWQKY